MTENKGRDRSLIWYSNRVKIGVIGALASGKTTFIKSISEKFHSISIKKYVEGIGYYDSTLAYDHGVCYAVKRNSETYERVSESEARRLMNEGEDIYRVEMWGSAGQLHLAGVRKTLIYPRVDGVLLFFDASREGAVDLSLKIYREAKESIPLLGSSKPVIVVFNKIDLVNMEAAKSLAESVLKHLDEEYVENETLFFTSALKGINTWLPVNKMISFIYSSK